MNLVERLTEFWAKFTTDIGVTVAVSISVLAFIILYFCVMRFLCNNNSGKVIPVIILAMIIFGGVVLFNEQINNFLFLIVPAIIVLLLVSLYSTELKRAIWSLNNNKLTDSVRSESATDTESFISDCVDEIIKALLDMSKTDTGAIIVLANDNISSQILQSGVKINGDISSELIKSIFFHKTPLHDGAMIINGTKVLAAGCFLPLSQQNDNLPKDLGTRHRAGIGITETIDVISIIVSEESGIISVAKGGKITRYADVNLLRKTLKNYYWQEFASQKR
ncbi:MAG: DNA integrity scanning protein DisA nucleotide-binding domain protein [Clostridia bacterium]|nr:DNA integrity scanning protein DisA nucleotide-binding domain protein [Clostridia bacterium]